MEARELNRMFDRLSPTAEQEEEGLRRLLRTERKVSPMKKLNKLVVAGIAAALLIVTCAAAVVATGIDQRLMDYFGWEDQGQELLLPGAVPLDIVVEDNGATLRLTQLLADRCTIMVTADFTAPEGTVLDVGYTDQQGFTVSDRWGYNGFDLWPEDHSKLFLDENGEALDVNTSYSFGWLVMEDDDPEDNHLSLVHRINLDKEVDVSQAAYLWLSAANYKAHDKVLQEDVILCYGNWSTAVPMPQKDIGWVQQMDCVVGTQNGQDVYLREVYLSPISLQVCMEQKGVRDLEGHPNYWPWITSQTYNTDEFIQLTTRDGQMVELQLKGVENWDVTAIPFRLTYRLITPIDPALFQGGTIRIDGFEVALDNLAPVAE